MERESFAEKGQAPASQMGHFWWDNCAKKLRKPVGEKLPHFFSKSLFLQGCYLLLRGAKTWFWPAFPPHLTLSRLIITVIPAKAGLHGSKIRWSYARLAWVHSFAETAVRLDLRAFSPANRCQLRRIEDERNRTHVGRAASRAILHPNRCSCLCCPPSWSAVLGPSGEARSIVSERSQSSRARVSSKACLFGFATLRR